MRRYPSPRRGIHLRGSVPDRPSVYFSRRGRIQLRAPKLPQHDTDQLDARLWRPSGCLYLNHTGRRSQRAEPVCPQGTFQPPVYWLARW